MSDAWLWLLTPLSGAAGHTIEPWAAWHGRCMVLAWGFMIPMGVLAARYFKATPRWPQQLDSKGWWHAHRALQWCGVLLMTVGGWLAWGQGEGASGAAQAHGWAGTGLLVVAWLQVAAGLARGSKGGPTEAKLRGDHYDMTTRRLLFERFHKGVGWLALVVALGTIVAGLAVVDAPRWMLLTLVVWWLVLTLAAIRWQRQGRCIDTYQALWGPDLVHPGNHRKPIGWGVRKSIP